MAELLDRITMDPAILHGKPVIRGLRYPVELLLELLSAGMTIEEILSDYEDLEREDVLAALAFAAKLIDTPRGLKPDGFSGDGGGSPRRERLRGLPGPPGR